RPVDLPALDRAVDVDLARAAGDRREHLRVEVAAAARDEELDDPVGRVHRHPAAEEPQRAPVVALAAAPEPGDAGGEEREVDQELDEPLHELRERVVGLEVVEPDQVDEHERGEEAEQDHRRVREAGPGQRRVAGDEAEREQVGERHRAGDVPVHLLVRAAEDRREEEEARERAQRHATRSSSLASSWTRARRETLARHSSPSVTGSSAPARQRSRIAWSSRAIPSTSSGATTTPAPVARTSSAAAPSGGTTARIGRPAARYSNSFPESTPRPRPPASGIRSRSASESRCSSSERRCGA